MTCGLPPSASAENVGAASHAGGGRIFCAIEGWQRLPGEDQRHRMLRLLHDHFPRFDDFIGIGGTQGDEPGNGAQRDQLLDGLVGRSIFADADGIVGEDPDRRNFHDGREADRHLHVVAEDEEGRTVGAKLRQHHAIDDRAHGVLANAEVEVARVVIVRLRNRPRRRT